MEQHQLYKEVEQKYISQIDFNIELNCINKKDLILKSRLLFDLFQDIKMKCKDSNYKYSILYLRCLKRTPQNNFSCLWRIFKMNSMNNLRLD